MEIVLFVGTILSFILAVICGVLSMMGLFAGALADSEEDSQGACCASLVLIVNFVFWTALGFVLLWSYKNV